MKKYFSTPVLYFFAFLFWERILNLIFWYIYWLFNFKCYLFPRAFSYVSSFCIASCPCFINIIALYLENLNYMYIFKVLPLFPTLSISIEYAHPHFCFYFCLLLWWVCLSICWSKTFIFCLDFWFWYIFLILVSFSINKFSTSAVDLIVWNRDLLMPFSCVKIWMVLQRPGLMSEPLSTQMPYSIVAVRCTAFVY